MKVPDSTAFNTVISQTAVSLAGHLDPGGSAAPVAQIDTTRAAQFTVSWITGTLNFSLTRPDSQVITPAYAAAHPDEVAYGVIDGSASNPPQASYFVTATNQIGQWTLNLAPGSLPADGTDYQAIAQLQTPRAFTATLDKTLYQVGDTAHLTATLMNGAAGLPGVAVSSLIRRPDGVTDTVALADQGGGLYTAGYVIPAAPGYLAIDVQAQGTDSGVAFTRDASLLTSIAPTDARLIGPYTEQPVNNNGDALYDTLGVSVGISATTATTYTLYGDLTARGQLIAQAQQLLPLAAGTQTATLSFDGNTIRGAFLNGPYTVTNLRLVNIGLGVTAQTANNVLTTRSYNWQDFGGCYGLTLAVNAPAGGTVAVSPTANCNAGTQYSAGTLVQLAATANPGYHFSTWSGDATSSENPLTATIDRDKSITATFDPGVTPSPTQTAGATQTARPTGTSPAAPTATPGGLSVTPSPTNTARPTSTSPAGPTATAGGPGVTPSPTPTAGPTNTARPTGTSPAAPTATPTGTPDCSLAWHVVANWEPGAGTNDELWSVATVSATDAWAVGRYSDGNRVDHPLIERWNGSTWTGLTSPVIPGQLRGVAVISATDVWAVGGDNHSLTLHWNGSTWSTVPSPAPGTGFSTLQTVTAISTNDVWAVGAYQTNSGVQTLAIHWDGSAWNLVASPNPAGGYNEFYGVASVATNDVWASGYYNSNGAKYPLVSHWDGTAWSVIGSPAISGDVYLAALGVLNSSDIWVVGSINYGGTTVIEHWDGATWNLLPGNQDGDLAAVSVITANDIWTVGTLNRGGQTLAEHWNGSAWTVVPSPNGSPYGGLFRGVSARGAGDVAAVGHAGAGAYTPLTERYNAGCGLPNATPTGSAPLPTATATSTATRTAPSSSATATPLGATATSGPPTNTPTSTSSTGATATATLVAGVTGTPTATPTTAGTVTATALAPTATPTGSAPSTTATANAATATATATATTANAATATPAATVTTTVTASPTTAPATATAPAGSAFAHLAPAGPLTVAVGAPFTLDLLINSGQNSVVGQQSYLTFTNSLLQVVTAGQVGCTPANTVSADGTTFEGVLQNTASNSSGEIAYGSGTFGAGTAPNSDFRVARVGFCASAPGDAVLHWQFSPPAPANRNSKITDDVSRTVSNPALYPDLVIHIQAGTLVAHTTWQGRPAQPAPLQQLPLTLTLSLSGTQTVWPNLTTDPRGVVTVPVGSLVPGNYAWRAKGPQFLGTSGTVALTGAVSTALELGLMRAGDANNDNLVDITDFSILHGTFGRVCGDGGFDSRADFNGDCAADITDFSLLRGNFGAQGAAPGAKAPAPPRAGAPETRDAFAALVPAAITVPVGSRVTLDLNATSGSEPLVGAQSYLLFPNALLQAVDPAQATCAAATAGGADTGTFETVLQNTVDNARGQIAYAAGTFGAGMPAHTSGRVARLAFCGVASGDAVLHWQFTQPGRSSTLVDGNGQTVSDPTLYHDLVIHVVGGVAPRTFSDVQASDYFYAAVSYLATRSVIAGYADGTFRPYSSTTRGQLAKIVVLGFGLAGTTPGGGGYTFADVPPAQPFWGVIETAAAQGLVSGYTCGGAGEPCDGQHRPYYRPYANVTRGQLAKIVVGAAGWAVLHPQQASFADVAPGTPFYGYVETAVCHGVLSGYACGGPGEPCDGGNQPEFRQYNNSTRGQIAKIVYLSLLTPNACQAGSP